MDDTQILVSLDDDRAKYIAEVISNKSCKKILNYLGQKEGTVSDVANDLKMPINTVDYNVKKLIRAGLIEKASHWWSVKGKKMPIYRVSNRKIVISPRSIMNYSKYLFALVITGIIALGLKSLDTGKTGAISAVNYVNDTSDVLQSGVANSAVNYVNGTSDALQSGVANSLPVLGEKAVGGAAKEATNVAVRSGDVFISGYLGMDVWLWFLFGAWFVIFMFFLFHIFKERGFRD